MAGPEARFLFELGKRVTNCRTGEAKERMRQEVEQGISITLARQVARQLRPRYAVQEAVAYALTPDPYH